MSRINSRINFVSVYYMCLKRISGVVSARVIQRLSDPPYPTNLFSVMNSSSREIKRVDMIL